MHNPIETITNCKFRKTTLIKHLTAYGPHLRCQLSFPPDEGRTKQSFKDECDINVIMRRYENTGVLEHVQKRDAQFVDVTGYDYQSAMDLVADARTAFNELPARIRDRFDNDPGQLLDFVHDKENAEEAAELGLMTPEGVEALQKAKAAAGAPAPAAAGAAPAAPAPSPDAANAASKPAAKP